MDNLGFSVDYVHLQSGFVKLNIFVKKLHKSKYAEWSKEAHCYKTKNIWIKSE